MTVKKCNRQFLFHIVSVIHDADLLFIINNVNSFVLFVSGEVGDWRNHFTPEQLKMFEEDYARQMKGVNIPFKTDLI